jgi:hypothetical protein
VFAQRVDCIVGHRYEALLVALLDHAQHPGRRHLVIGGRVINASQQLPVIACIDFINRHVQIY